MIPNHPQFRVCAYGPWVGRGPIWLGIPGLEQGLHFEQFKSFWADCGHRFKAEKLIKTRQIAPPSVENEILNIFSEL